MVQSVLKFHAVYRESPNVHFRSNPNCPIYVWKEGVSSVIRVWPFINNLNCHLHTASVDVVTLKCEIDTIVVLLTPYKEFDSRDILECRSLINLCYFNLEQLILWFLGQFLNYITQLKYYSIYNKNVIF